MTAPRPRDVRWTIAICAAAVLATAAADLAGADALVGVTASIRAGEAWRLLTGPLVHGSWAHLARDLTVLAVMGACYERSLRDRWPLALLAGTIVPAACVAVVRPDSLACYGLSGATYTVIAVALIHEWRGAEGVLKWAVTAFAVAAAIKLAWEAGTGTLLLPMEIGVARPAPEAHLAGAIAGVVVMVVPRWRGPRAAESSTKRSAGSALDPCLPMS